MLTEEEIKALPNVIEARLTELNNSVLESFGKRIKDIGELKPSDYKKLQQLSEYGSDVDKITSDLAAIVKKSEAEIYALINKVAVECYGEASAKEALKAYGENKELQKFVTSMAKQTQDTFVNMSQTTAFMVYDDNGNKVVSSLSKTYQNVIDKAVTTVTTGVTDYQSAMRQTLRALADSGLRTKYRPLQGSAGKAVDYASGYSRRLDTAVRQNILWGAKQCNQTAADMLGEELGMDGYEISYHSAPRPSHEAMGGRQYAIGKARKVNGVYYPSFSEVESLLQDYGCLHFKNPITLGVSVPAYTDSELEALKANDRRIIEFEGKEYTPYEAQQVMRKLETSARHAKDRQIIAKAAGDDVLRREEQLKINQITQKYKEFANASKLPTKMERMSVSGYRRVKTTTKTVDKSSKSGKIKLAKANDLGEMKSYMKQKHNIEVDNSLCDLDFEICQKSLKGFEAICSEYPELSNKIQKIKIARDGVMSCTGDTISFNPKYFKSSKELDEICKEQSKTGFWVRNASPDSLMAHECGHAIEGLLIEANPNYVYDFQRTLAWQDCTEAKSIVSKAIKEIQKTEYGKGKEKIDLVSTISRYALQDDSETLAEAFADVYANGDKANLLSLKIKEIIKLLFDQYRKDRLL